MLLAQGTDGDRMVPPVPDDGDQWSRHHTTLARKAVRWIVENVNEGDVLPTQTKLCAALGCTPSALRRVMDALVQDGTLDFQGKGRGRGRNQNTMKFVRRGNPKVVGWLPPHLRSEMTGDEGSPCAC